MQNGVMHYSLHDLTLRERVNSCPSIAPRIIQVFWALPPTGLLKINTDGIELGSSGLAGGGGIVHNSCGFVPRVLYVPFGDCFAYESELCVTLHSIEVAQSLS